MTTFLTNLVESEQPSRNGLWCEPHSFQVSLSSPWGIAWGSLSEVGRTALNLWS
ncbi:MAG: hypothetical protein N2112_17195 [Gemmataceae bacterium]|nr:hypothetical protein [Gemmataceae bacterium]